MKIKTLLMAGALASVSAFALDLTSFEDANWTKRVTEAKTQDFTIVQEHASHGKSAAKVLFRGSLKDSWPGFKVVFTEDEIKENNTLLFTAWQEDSGRLEMSIRIDYYEGESTFSGFSISPKSLQNIEIPLYFKNADGNVKLPKAVFIYRRCPRKDAIVWFDNFKMMNGMAKFKPIVYVPPKGHRTPTDEEKAFGAQLFSRTWMEHIFRNVKPLPSDDANPVLKAAACPGEAEPVMLSIHALKDIASAKVTVPAPLKSADGGEIAPSAFTVQYLGYLDKRPTYQSLSYYKQIPMLLEKRESIAVKANESQSFWIDVDVPANARPGLYKGSVLLTLDGQSKSIPYELKVRPFVTPEATDMMFGEYLTYPRGLVKTFEDKVAQYEHDMELMRKLNFTSVGFCHSFDISKCDYKDGKVTINFLDDEMFVVFMNLYVKHKYPCPVILLADPGDKFALRLGLKEFSPEYKACYQAFWKAMQEECKARNWPELIVQPEDEPGWRSSEIQKRNVQLLKYLKEIPGMRTEEDGPVDSYCYTQAGPYSDEWNFNGCVAAPEKMVELAKEGRLVALYNNDVESYRPATSRYVAGFFMARSKANGVFNWAMRSYGGSPFNDFDSRYGDTTNYYPGDGTRPGGPGIGMLSFREGIDDFRYIRYLQTLIKQKPGKEADYAQKVLDEILGSIRYFTQIRNAGAFKTLPVAPNGDNQVTGVFNLKTGWTLEDYDHAREIIATQIETLLGVKDAAKGAKPPVLNLAASTSAPVYADGPATTRNSYKVAITRCKNAPVIDGKLDDDCWQTAGLMQDFSINIGGKPKAQTKAWIATDGEKLYLATEAEEEFMSHITANISEKNGPVYNDDCVEFFFDPNLKMQGFYQLSVNPIGAIYCGGTLGGWNPDVKVATQKGTDRWFVELSMPLKDLKLAGSSFGFNVCRERRPLEVFELSCWSPTGGSFGQPARFGLASMGSTWIRSVNVDTAIVGKGSINVSVINPNANDDELTVETAWKLLDGKKVLAEEKATEKAVPGKKTAELVFPTRLAQAGELEVMVTIKNAKGNQLEKQVVRREVKSPVSIFVSSPFVGDDWKASMTIDYLQDAGEKLELQVWTISNPKQVTKLKTGRNSRFDVTLYKGAFSPLDGLCAKLVDLKSKRTIGTTEITLFAK